MMHHSTARFLTRLAAAALPAMAVAGGCDTMPIPPDGTVEPPFHQKVFTRILANGYQSPADCRICHENVILDLQQTGHWKWRGTSVNIAGREAETHGKRDLLNAFFIGVPSNEARCSQCHPGFGWTDATFDFAGLNGVDCFICHDTTGTYAKHPTSGGGGASLLQSGQPVLTGPADLTQVVYNVGVPTRRNCGACHFYADGGDNVKHGDLSSDLANPTREMDVHMGGLDFACQTCHTMRRHGIAGFGLHSVNEGGGSPRCTRCHSATAPHTQYPALDVLLNLHVNRLACELCHIPTYARSKPTIVGWYWNAAGQNLHPTPVDAHGRPTYDKDKGSLVWALDVQPTPRWFNGKWRRMIVGSADTYAAAGTPGDPVILAEPTATAADADAKIYPFKVMYGRQPADTVNKRLIVPHLFGSAAGPNAYWGSYNWALALQEGAAYSGVPFSGTYGFPNTVTYLRVSHEIAPKERALMCESCHGQTWFWSQLGITDPLVP